MNSAGEMSYQPVVDWEQLPRELVHRDVSDVAVDSQDRVYVLTRMDARVIVYDRDGNFIRKWGDGLFTPRVHGITVGFDDSVFIVDELDQTVRKFTADGDQLLVIGSPGVESDTGIDWNIANFAERVGNTKRGGPPFNHPTRLAVAPNGDLYVADGYGNARVHQFTSEGELIRSWGEPGSGEGEFRVPHGVCVDEQGRVLVADSQNDRIQIFTLEGRYLETWPAQRPNALAVDKDGFYYVGEARWEPGGYSWARGIITEFEWARVSIMDAKGKVQVRIGGGVVWPDDACEPGNFVAAHGIAVDSRGDLYVAHPTYSSGGSRGLLPESCHTLDKLARKR